MFDSGQPKFNDRMFREYDFFYFYRYAKDNVLKNIPEERGNSVTISVIVDASHIGTKLYQHSQTAIIIFIHRTPIRWYSKNQQFLK